MVIRNVVTGRLRAGHDPDALERVLDGFRTASASWPGCKSYTLGVDLGLREGNWGFAIVADFEDAAAYRAYDADAEHNRLRAEMAPLVEELTRVQFEL